MKTTTCPICKGGDANCLTCCGNGTVYFTTRQQSTAKRQIDRLHTLNEQLHADQLSPYAALVQLSGLINVYSPVGAVLKSLVEAIDAPCFSATANVEGEEAA